MEVAVLVRLYPGEQMAEMGEMADMLAQATRGLTLLVEET